jgi:hypothetical protein
MARLLTIPLLVLAFAAEAAAQPVAPGAEPAPSEVDPGRQTAIERGLPPRPPGSSPLAELSPTPFERSELPGLLVAVAGYLRQVVSDASATVVIDPNFNPGGGFPYPPPHPNLPPVVPTTEELDLLRTALNAEIRASEETLVNCRPPVGCELNADHLFVLGQPMLHVDGTVTMAVEHVSRTEPGSRRATFTTLSQFLLTRTDGAWTVTGARTLMMT